MNVIYVKQYQEIKNEILILCNSWRIQPVPSITIADDMCDITNPPYIRIKPIKDINGRYQARLILGHYIVGLYLTSPDYVADLIADML